MKPRPIRWWWDSSLPDTWVAHARRAFKRGRALCGAKLGATSTLDRAGHARCPACVDVALATPRWRSLHRSVRGDVR